MEGGGGADKRGKEHGKEKVLERRGGLGGRSASKHQKKRSREALNNGGEKKT